MFKVLRQKRARKLNNVIGIKYGNDNVAVDIDGQITNHKKRVYKFKEVTNQNKLEKTVMVEKDDLVEKNDMLEKTDMVEKTVKVLRKRKNAKKLKLKLFSNINFPKNLFRVVKESIYSNANNDKNNEIDVANANKTNENNENKSIKQRKSNSSSKKLKKICDKVIKKRKSNKSCNVNTTFNNILLSTFNKFLVIKSQSSNSLNVNQEIKNTKKERVTLKKVRKQRKKVMKKLFSVVKALDFEE